MEGDSSVLTEPAIEAPVEGGASALSPMADSLPRGAGKSTALDAIMERPVVPCSALMSSSRSMTEGAPLLKMRSAASSSASSEPALTILAPPDLPALLSALPFLTRSCHASFLALALSARSLVSASFCSLEA